LHAQESGLKKIEITVNQLPGLPSVKGTAFLESPEGFFLIGQEDPTILHRPTTLLWAQRKRPIPKNPRGGPVMRDYKLCGWEEIANFLNRPESTVRSWRRKLEEAGVVFKELRGKPPRVMTCAYASDLKEWDKGDHMVS
jgi:hypothetical protein